jgi:hypothetical protein
VSLLGASMGTWVHRASQQREAVKALERCQANIWYATFTGPLERPWYASQCPPLRRRLPEWGRDFLYPVTGVTIRNPSSAVSDVDLLPALAKLHRVTHLDLGKTPVTNQGLRYFSQLRRLETLDLAETRLNEGDVDHLRGLKLVWLSVNRTRFSDRSLSSLRAMRSLAYLDLTRTKVSDRGIDILLEMPGLREVRLNRSLVTRAGYDRLRFARPDWIITWEPLQHS